MRRIRFLRRRGRSPRFRGSRFSQFVSTVIRETLNVYRHQMLWLQLQEMRRMRRLNDLLTDLTIDRIVEAAELALLMHADAKMAIDFVTYDLSLRFKRQTPLVIRPYLRIPRHYDTSHFLLHPTFWTRLHQFHSIYPAPTYPLEL
ncbi:unnamed protein product [Echinostoma caproni]|uniref:Uncharacterized protein n=1 Tax=Echinostoma caproni TaxID=27848 RepID=A0A3P8I0W5_9TREM|nr:unnamed protein product [Echinostoma caproni]